MLVVQKKRIYKTILIEDALPSIFASSPSYNQLN